MKFLIKGLREGVGRLIVLVYFIFSPKRIKRDEEIQKKIDEQCKNFALYQFYACPFCIKARRNIKRLNLNIEKRSVSEGSPYRSELLEQGGKVQVPCLRIQKGNEVEWLYESEEIIKFLESL
jgi:glutaredoxin